MMYALGAFSATAFAIARISSAVNTRPVGFDGLRQITALVCGDKFRLKSSISKLKSFAAGNRYVVDRPPAIRTIVGYGMKPGLGIKTSSPSSTSVRRIK